jgi:hypothetical protein
VSWYRTPDGLWLRWGRSTPESRPPFFAQYESWLARAKAVLARFVLLIEFCHRCGRRVDFIWWTNDALWRALRGDDPGPWCARCFDREARRRGALAYWAVTLGPERADRGAA